MFTAKKSLGQNFLKSEGALRAMVTAGDVHPGDFVLEVGPGKGVLTKKLLLVGAKVMAIEKDHRLIPLLKEEFGEQISLIEGDVLNMDIPDGQFKVVANIPYYITGQFLRKFLSGDRQPERIVVLVQKEIADRIVARDEKESLLSLSVKVFGTPVKIMKVEKKYFSPAPKVDSAILSITDISRKNFIDTEAEDKFFTLIKTGFGQKRKILLSNLKKGGYELDDVFAELKIDPKVRAEDLQLSQWLEILRRI